jgi:lysyl-tRNA synthetase class 2
MQKNWQKLKSNAALRERFLLRETVIDAIRLFFKSHAFHEVETPLMVSAPGAEPYLNLFETVLQLPGGASKPAYLLTSPEYALKKLLAANMGSIFEICKTFRNSESLGGTHNPEFTILEFYHADANYLDVMNDFEAMMLSICQALGIDAKNFSYQGRTFDLSAPYLRFSIAELFTKYLDLDANQLLDIVVLRAKATTLGYDLSGIANLSDDLAWEELYNQLFLNEIEPKLAEFSQPVIVYDYPAPQAALARKKATDPRFAERFEVYLAGMELGNAFGELIDPVEQKNRLEADLELRRELGKKDQPIDYDFVAALESGLPECSGMAVGIDRLIMLFANVDNIDEVLFFPASQLFENNSI